ncbi:MAG: cysteine--tRNA ligase [Hyphomicrobiales bacterium]|nr:cysteine--tRNA ligase [Hyphomicrobiales bacterium]
MALELYNTLTRKKQPFAPLDPERVRMYVCGPTVYDYAHIGNARPIVVFDLLYRLLRHLYGADHVIYARNITDVDDKINARAKEEGVPIGELTERTTAQFHADIAALGALPPDIEPRATGHIAEMIALIERLIETGHAYAAEGHALFHVPAMPGYGALSRRSTDEMLAGARVDVAPYKKDPMDFVLWKPSAEDEPGWESPWGRGRPGWHIECSAMSAAHLGKVFDIHGGGVDLVFPHHENEIAQSTCAHGTEIMAQVWMHNGYLQVEGEKMSKSLGNFFTVHDLLQDWPGEAIRLAMLTTHYRQPLNWTEAGVREAKRTLDHWYELTAEAETGCMLCAGVLQALEDDLNTPKALAAMHELRHQAAKGEAGAADCLKACARFLGLLGQSAEDWAAWRPGSVSVDETEVESLIAARAAARDGKNWAEADRIRDLLAGMGVALKDGPEGTTWTIAR